MIVITMRNANEDVLYCGSCFDVMFQQVYVHSDGQPRLMRCIACHARKVVPKGSRIETYFVLQEHI